RLIEVRAKPVIDDINQTRQGHSLFVENAGSHFRWAIKTIGLAVAQADRAFADFLKAIVFEPDLIIELVGWAAIAPWQLGSQMPKEHVKAFQIGVLIRDYLAQESIKAAKRQHLFAPQFRFVRS